MSAWRTLLTVMLFLLASPVAWAQTVELSEAIKPGECARYSLTMKLAGEMRFLRDDAKPSTVKLTATATHGFDERILTAEDGSIRKVARVYDLAKAAIERGTDRSENTLRATRKLIIAQRHKGTALAYSPSGCLTRSEQELVSEHFDTLALVGLLPGKAVKVGESWKIANETVQALTGIADLTDHKLTAKVEKMNGREVSIVLSGTASGVWNSAKLETSIEATATFDTEAKRLTALVWKQKDDRDQGPLNPASSLTVTTTLTRKPIDRPASLEEVALVSVPEGFAPGAHLINLEYRDAKSRYSLLHSRDWHLTAVSENHAVFRLMDKLWIAQVTITPWTKAKKGEHLSAEQFKQAMSDTSGWKPERELQAGEIPAEGGKWMYRYSVLGQLNGVNVLQNFYLVAAPSGEQVVLTFTMAPRMADKLGARDLTLAASIEVPAEKKE